ncbi:MAG: protein translocase subunit SecF [Nanoarchaeota archaeon]
MEENKISESHEKNWYDKSYKILLVIPIILFLGSFAYLYFFYAENGDIVYKDVSITGGTTMTVFAKTDIKLLEENLREKLPDVIVNSITDFRSREQTGFLVETTASSDELKSFLEDYLGFKLNSENSSIEFTGATLSSSFYQQLRFAMIISFVLMAIVVFFIFRTPIRSLSIILAGFADIIMTIVVIDILEIRLSVAGIVALLMLIGYSVDVDIMLTTRVVKEKTGSLNHRIFEAFKTGITMTLTAIAAVGVALIFTRSFSPALSQMFTIILIGLCFDIFNCWVTNASLLKWYAEVTKKI